VGQKKNASGASNAEPDYNIQLVRPSILHPSAGSMDIVKGVQYYDLNGVLLTSSTTHVCTLSH
jgi:hypothetical protein